MYIDLVAFLCIENQYEYAFILIQGSDIFYKNYLRPQIFGNPVAGSILIIKKWSEIFPVLQLNSTIIRYVLEL